MIVCSNKKHINVFPVVPMYYAILIFTFLCIGEPFLVKNVVVFDKTGNDLFYVLFEYDSSGVFEGKSIYDADSTFLNHSVIKKHSNGNINREDYSDYKEDTIFQSTRTIKSDAVELNFIDNYNKEKLVLQQTYKKGSTSGTYDFLNHVDKLNHRVAYKYTSTGAISKIEIFDKKGVLTHYATVAYQSTGIPDFNNKQCIIAARKLILLGKQRMNVSFTLKKNMNVKINIYNLSGKIVCCLMDRTLTKGSQSYFFNLISDNYVRSSGVYFVNFEIAGINTIKKINILK